MKHLRPARDERRQVRQRRISFDLTSAADTKAGGPLYAPPDTAQVGVLSCL